MKVVLFCGGQGTRLRDYSETIPKPMVPVGYRPILWHVMKYYAHFGHRDFILALGYRADAIKDFFLHYEEAVSNDFVLSDGGKRIELANSDIADWTITFVDTGAASSIGERLRRVRRHLEGEDVFMANYADGVTDLHLPSYIDEFKRRDVVASFVAIRPPGSYHAVQIDENGWVRDSMPIAATDTWINGGYFIFKNAIFDYVHKGEELAVEPFARLIKDHQLTAHRHTGFWAPMDTFKDKQLLDDLYRNGHAPWQVWNGANGT
ncbi:MAG: glucose-1-phosphate cytidylyltransferase [Gammaproteobacteria bacterium]|nr:glucose-1-phosphate cytidylyltransferase [Gammaproteobacteria bacterium]